MESVSEPQAQRVRKNVLGVLVDVVNYSSAVARVLDAAKRGQRCTTSALAVHGVMTGVLDEEHRYRLNHLDLVCPDGQPVRWALNWLHGAGLSERVYGPRLTLEICRAAAEEGLSVFLYGSTPEVLDLFSQNLTRRFPGLQIAGQEPSKFRRLAPREKDELVGRIRASGAKITLVGLGCPRQEVWAFEFGDALSAPVVAVGAAFDFHAGTLAQAPALLQRWGLEWVFRLMHEPRRLWKRYVFLNPHYLALLILQATGLRRFEPDGLRAPDGELLFG